MNIIRILFAALFIFISFCPPVFAELQKFPLDTSHLWFWYGSASDSGGPQKELNPNDSFRIINQKVHISCGNLFDKERHYNSNMGPQGDVIASGDFKFELTFKNFISLNLNAGYQYQRMSFNIGNFGNNSRYVAIQISKEGPYYEYSTWVWPDDIGGLILSTLSNSGTFIIEQKGTNITLSVKGVPHATWTYSGISFYRFRFDLYTGTQSSGKVEVDILSISAEGVEFEPPGGPKPPPPPFTHGVSF